MPYYLCFTSDLLIEHSSTLLTSHVGKAWLWSLADLDLDLDHDIYDLISTLNINSSPSETRLNWY